MNKDLLLLYYTLSPANYVVQLVLANADDFIRLLTIEEQESISKMADALEIIQKFYQDQMLAEKLSKYSKELSENDQTAYEQHISKANKIRNEIIQICKSILFKGMEHADYIFSDKTKFKESIVDINCFESLFVRLKLNYTIANNATEDELTTTEFKAINKEIAVDEEQFDQFENVFDQWMMSVKEINGLIKKSDIIEKYKNQTAKIRNIIQLNKWQKYRTPEKISHKQEFLSQLKISEIEIRLWCLKHPEQHENINEIYKDLKQEIDEEESSDEYRIEKIKAKIEQFPAGIYYYQLAKHVLKTGDELSQYKWAEFLPKLYHQRFTETDIQILGVIGGITYYLAEHYLDGEDVTLSYGMMQTLLSCAGNLITLSDIAYYLNYDPVDVAEYQNILRYCSGLILHVMVSAIFKGFAPGALLGFSFAYIVATSAQALVGLIFDLPKNERLHQMVNKIKNYIPTKISTSKLPLPNFNQFNNDYHYIIQALKWLCENIAYSQGQKYAAIIYRDFTRNPNEMLQDTEFCFKYKNSCTKLANQKLNLKTDASFEEAKEAYKSLSKQYHPDKFTGDGQIFKELESAMSTLRQLRKQN